MAPIGTYGKHKLPSYSRFEDYYLMLKAQSQNPYQYLLPLETKLLLDLVWPILLRLRNGTKEIWKPTSKFL